MDRRTCHTFLALALVLPLVLVVPACAQKPAAATAKPEQAPQTDDQKTLYALGLVISQNLANFNLTPEELAFIQQGLADGTLKKTPKVELETYGPKIQGLAQTRATAAAATEKVAAKAFLDKAAAEAGAMKTDSGLIYQEVSAGTGEAPKATDKVKVNYEGKLADGSVFDSSIQRGEPAELALNQVIPCWTEGLQKMKVGGKAKIYCPSDLAYGDRGAPPKIKPGAALVFDVELLSIEE